MDKTVLGAEEYDLVDDRITFDGAPLYWSVILVSSLVETWGVTELTPTTKNTPEKMARGIVPKTTSKGPVIVPMIASPIRKCDTLCSTTLSGTVIFFRRLTASLPSVRMT